MGLDDDRDCVVHDWGLAELAVNPETWGLDRVQRCSFCGAVQYEGHAADARRPPL